jgi:hypothetical protein
MRVCEPRTEEGCELLRVMDSADLLQLLTSHFSQSTWLLDDDTRDLRIAHVCSDPPLVPRSQPRRLD